MPQVTILLPAQSIIPMKSWTPGTACYDAPQNVVISPNFSYVTPFHKLNCSADAHPPVEYYTWSDVSQPDQQVRILTEGWDANTIILSDDFMGREDVMIVCTVRNTLFSRWTKEASANHTFTIEIIGDLLPAPRMGLQPYEVASITVGTVLLVAILSIFIGFGFYKLVVRPALLK